MKTRKSKTRKLHKSNHKHQILSFILVSNFVLIPIMMLALFFIQGPKYPVAATLPNEILSNMTTLNNSGTTNKTRWTADGSSKQVNFEISGDQPENQSTILTGPRYAILTIPDELKNQVTPDGTGEIKTTLTIPFKDVSLSHSVLESLDSLSVLLSNIKAGGLGNITNVTFDAAEIEDMISALKNELIFENIECNVTFTLSEDGSYLVSNLDDSLNSVIAEKLTAYLIHLQDMINNLHAVGNGILGVIVASAINTALVPAKSVVTTAINILLPLLTSDSEGSIGQYSALSTISSTKINIPTNIVAPQKLKKDVEVKFVGSTIKTDTFDIETIRTGDGTTSIYYAAMPGLYIRQVVLSPQDSLVIPTQGYFNLVHNDSHINFSSSSGEQLDLGYKEILLDMQVRHENYEMASTIPEYYKYAGYVISTEDIVHQPEQRNQQNMQPLDFSSNPFYWITVYIEPTTQQNEITPYSWYYQTNTLGELQP